MRSFSRAIMNTFIKDIPELQTKNVYMKHPKEVENKLKILIEGGNSKLQLVTDFDQTLTRQWNENGKKPLSSFGMLEECPSVPNDYRTEAKRLYNLYRPMELDPTIPNVEKVKHFEDWWGQTLDLLKGYRVPLEELDKVAEGSGASLRDGTIELLKKLNAAGVPVLVFSAGLGDSVMAVLKHHDVMLPNLKVISNFLKYNEDGTVSGTHGEIIHTLNKNEQSLHDTDYYKLVQDRGNVLLMGDTVGDASMADGVPHCNVVLRIGFLYDKVQEHLDGFMENFDIVLVDDQTMDVITAIVRLVLRSY